MQPPNISNFREFQVKIPFLKPENYSNDTPACDYYSNFVIFINFRVAVFCETGVAKVSHKLKKIWQSLGEGRVKCVRGKMPVVISK